MRDLDVGRFLRLRETIHEATAALSDTEPLVGFSVMAQTYARFREAALDLIPPEHADEFWQVCPEIDDQKMGRAENESGGNSMLRAQLFVEAKTLLGALQGFLNGYIAETQMAMDAEAKARLAQESHGQYL